MVIPENEPLKVYKVQNFNKQQLLKYIAGDYHARATMFSWQLSPYEHHYGDTYYANLREEAKSYLHWLLKNEDKMENHDPSGARWDYDRRPEGGFEGTDIIDAGDDGWVLGDIEDEDEDDEW